MKNATENAAVHSAVEASTETNRPNHSQAGKLDNLLTMNEIDLRLRRSINRQSEALNETVSTMHAAGASIAEIVEATGLSYEVVRGRGRRMGLFWRGKPAAWTGPFYDMNDGEREAYQRNADARLIRALAVAFARGEHLPQAMRQAA